VIFAPSRARRPHEFREACPKPAVESGGKVCPFCPGNEKLRPLAEILKSVLQKLSLGLDNPDYNLTINTVPRGDEDKSYFLWHIEILPRLTTPAGFEFGSGMSINTVLPEEAAAYLKAVDVS
jgi:UDPglucose--hexose-1-phosphate uridylyltransferase